MFKIIKIKRNFSRYSAYKIKLFKVGRFKKPFYKIVVVNSKNRIISQIGYYNPHSIGKLNQKTIGLDRSACITWLKNKKAIPSFFVFFIFEKLGLIKSTE